ncbi:hypothetical protein B0H14DRAFT_2883650 [Mycena olivaceomarginata]|nr:hypothetical protein B0H14DRAFT_2883650 [Mycena olivaceomarginata]
MGRHPQLYFPDGTMTIKASDGTLYNVYRAPLICQSEFCSAMLTLPNPKQPPLSLTQNAKEWFERSRHLNLECTSDATALELPPQFSATEIEKFLHFIFLEAWSPRRPILETACAILKLSHFLVVENGIAYTRYHLSDHPDLKAVLRLKLGFDYHFVDWITAAFDELIGSPIKDISEEDEVLMGWVAYRALARAQADVLDARLTLAVRVPDWAKMWTSMDGVLGALIKEELPGAAILAKLPFYHRGGMNSECHSRTCEGLQDQAPDQISILKQEEGIVDGHLAGLLRVRGIA